MKKTAKLFLLITAALFAVPKAHAQISIDISISANIAPPALPVYVQPACPNDGYLWQPGYWAWDPDAQDYYWVPGVWVAAPQPGYLWTPAYWGYAGGSYGFHPGYWGPHVGFYGGINYGGGYLGIGFAGGNWDGGHFRYNTAVVNVNRTVIHNTYIDRTVIVNNTIINNNHTSFNGQGGVAAQPRPEELAAMKEHHIPPTAEQTSHAQTAHADKSAFSKSNGGKPTTTAMNKVGGAHYTQQGTKAPRTNNMAAKPAGNIQNNAQHNNAAKPQTNPGVNRPATDNAPKEQPKQNTQPKQQHVQTNRPQQQNRQAAPRKAPQQRPQSAPKPHNEPKPEEKH